MLLLNIIFKSILSVIIKSKNILKKEDYQKNSKMALNEHVVKEYIFFASVNFVLAQWT